MGVCSPCSLVTSYHREMLSCSLTPAGCGPVPGNPHLILWGPGCLSYKFLGLGLLCGDFPIRAESVRVSASQRNYLVCSSEAQNLGMGWGGPGGGGSQTWASHTRAWPQPWAGPGVAPLPSEPVCAVRKAHPGPLRSLTAAGSLWAQGEADAHQLSRTLTSYVSTWILGKYFFTNEILSSFLQL